MLSEEAPKVKRRLSADFRTIASKRQRHIASVTLVIVLSLAGCRSVPSADPDETRNALPGGVAAKSIPRAADADANRTNRVADSSIEPAAFFVERTTTTTNDPDAGESISLTLDSAVAISLERNPDLVVVRSGEPVAHAAYHVAKTYPFNPQFQTQVLPYTRDRQGNDAPVSQQHVLVQTFELGGQSQFRTGAAAATWEQVRHTIQQAEVFTIAQTERLYFTALYQRELLALNRLIATLNEELLGVMERRLKAGLANSSDVALARLQAESSRRQQRLMEANYQTALMSLLSYLDFAEGTDVELTDRWGGWQWRSAADALRSTVLDSIDLPTSGLSVTSDGDDFDPAFLRQIVAERPDVVAARAGVTAARENLALAEAMRSPNLQIGPMWQRDNTATQYWGVQGQINIPVVNTGVPLVDQRRAELQQQQVTAARLEEKAVLAARAAIRRYERARRLVEQSQGEFAQAIPDVLKTFEDQFQAGQITLLQVFAARTSLVQSRQSFLDLLNELAQAAADVTLTTTLPATQLILEPPPAPQTSAVSVGRASGVPLSVCFYPCANETSTRIETHGFPRKTSTNERIESTDAAPGWRKTVAKP